MGFLYFIVLFSYEKKIRTFFSHPEKNFLQTKKTTKWSRDPNKSTTRLVTSTSPSKTSVLTKSKLASTRTPARRLRRTPPPTAASATSSPSSSAVTTSTTSKSTNVT